MVNEIVLKINEIDLKIKKKNDYLEKIKIGQHIWPI